MRRIHFLSLPSAAGLALCIAAGQPSPVSAQAALPTTSQADRDQARAIFKELIEINTTDTALGNVTTGSTAMQKRFLDAGFPAEDVHLLGPDARKMNLVVRYAGRRHAD